MRDHVRTRGNQKLKHLGQCSACVEASQGSLTGTRIRLPCDTGTMENGGRNQMLTPALVSLLSRCPKSLLLSKHNLNS